MLVLNLTENVLEPRTSIEYFPMCYPFPECFLNYENRLLIGMITHNYYNAQSISLEKREHCKLH